MKQITPIRETSIIATSTLLTIPVGETMFCPFSLICEGTVRSAVCRLQQRGKARFNVATATDGLEITRLSM